MIPGISNDQVEGPRAKMSYRLQVDEELPQGVKRIALEEIDEALAQLQLPDDDLDEAVHESRKCFKKLRGLLRLVRKEIGEEVYQRENVAFRDAGRLLSDLRDSKVMIQTLDKLQEGAAKAGAAKADNEEVIEAFMTLRETLVIFYHATRRRVVEEEQALAEVIARVQQARARVDGWPIADDSFTAVAGGLRKIYKRGQNRMHDAVAEPAAETLHEWRKRVKYLWYGVRILHPIWPQPMATLADEIHDLSDLLGDDHDLHQFQTFWQQMQVPAEKRPLILKAHGDHILALVQDKRAALQTDAFPLGRRIYAEKPDAFVNRLNTYWDATCS